MYLVGCNVLAKSTNYTGDIFFVTDGVDNAKWMTPDDIVKGVNK